MDWILKQNKENNGKTSETRIKYVIWLVANTNVNFSVLPNKILTLEDTGGRWGHMGTLLFCKFLVILNSSKTKKII